MVQTRTQIAAQGRTITPKAQGAQSRVTQSTQRSPRSSGKYRPTQRAALSGHAKSILSPAGQKTTREEVRAHGTPVLCEVCRSPSQKPDIVQGLPEKRARRSESPSEQIPDDRSPKRRRATENLSRAEVVIGCPENLDDPIRFWAIKGDWPPRGPPEYSEYDGMDRLIARKKSSPSLRRKRSDAELTSTLSDQRPREEKSALYKEPRYEFKLETKGTFMKEYEEGIAEASTSMCQKLLDHKQDVPRESVFDDAVFKDACQNLQSKNEARIIQDISRLIVPSAETLALRVGGLKCLVESVNEGWNNSIPLTGARPQPDYAVGFAREAFTEEQLDKISPILGDLAEGDQSYFMATYYMLFPFLTNEVKCGAQALDIADRQNAHSMTLAVRAIVELFGLVGRERELHREILAFSISHDNRSVRIYGHYPVMGENDTKYYRHPIREFAFTELDGKEKWTAYRFTKNIYDLWIPEHLEKIRSAINQLPSGIDFDVPPISESTGLSQSLDSHHLGEELTSQPMGNQSTNAEPQVATPDSSFVPPGIKRQRKPKT